MKIKLIPDQPYVFHHHFHISNSGLTEPVERSEKEEAFKLFGGGAFGKKVNDLMIILNMKQDVIMTDDDWEAVLDSMNAGPVQGLPGEDVLMEHFSKKDRVEVGISLMQYVKKTKVPSLILRTALISMCGKKYPDIVFREYEDLLKQNFSLDAESYMKLIKGFLQTSHWKKCLEFVKHLPVEKEVHEKGAGLVLKAALANNDLRTINHLLSETCKHYGFLFLPDFCTSEIYLAWEEGHIDIKTLLKILSEHKGYITSQKLKEFPEILNRKGDNFKVHWGQIIQGRCSVCSQTLKGGTITASQIETLKQRFHKYLSAKNTIYMHTSPKRYMKYCNWIKKKGPFELVVDAANVYYTMDVLNRDIDLLLNKIKKLQEIMEMKGKVLYVCPYTFKKHFKEAAENLAWGEAYLYATEPKDDDDLFMVLAALHSGPQCYIVSQDHFRDMKNYLGEDTKQLFELWQRCQQILATDAKPQPYDFCVQKHITGWHIPYMPWGKKNRFEPDYSMPGKLLCLQRPQ